MKTDLSLGQQMERLYEAHKAAGQALAETAERLFPIGTQMEVCVHGKWLRVEVIGHGNSWWYEPGTLLVRNLKTGKNRKVSVSTLTVDMAFCVTREAQEVTELT